MNIGNKIKELRKQRGITQEQLANRIGVSFQAVSKWENNVALPDITLAPALASFFCVSMDILFDFDLKAIEDKAFSIAKESWKYRNTDRKKARDILQSGLAQYPDNDILLSNLLYVVDYDKNPDEVLKIASTILDVTKDEAIRYDTYRFMAYAYRAKSDMDSARKIIEQIPEIYFSRLSEKACILMGEEKWKSACKEASQALFMLMLMKEKIAECHVEKGNTQSAMTEYEQALKVLDVLEASEAWDVWREKFTKCIADISQ